MSPQNRAAYVAETRTEYARIAAAHARGEQNKQRVSIADARANALKLDWKSYAPPRPGFFGTRVFADYGLAELEPLIDWSPFFATWELTGKFPAILDDPKFGEAARPPFAHARAMLDNIIAEPPLPATAVVRFCPANQHRDDIAGVAGRARRAAPPALHPVRHA